MKSRSTAFALLVVISFGSTLNAADIDTDSAQNFIKEWAETFNKNDPEKLSAFYERGKVTIVIVSSGLRYRGFDSIQEIFRESQEQVRFNESSPMKMETRVLGDTALVTFEHVFKIRILADGSHWQVHIRTTSVLRRVSDKWKIALEHSSAIRGVERMTRIDD